MVEVIGLEGLRGLEELVSRKVHDTGVTKEEWREVLSRLDILESRMNMLEHDMVEVKSEMRELRKGLNTKFLWMIGLLFGGWITIILTIFFKT